MNFLRRWWWLVALVVLIAVWALFFRGPQTPLGQTTRMELEALGGFAYVPSQNGTLEIAYLKDTEVEGCKVDQLGVDLMVVSGNIVEPASAPANRMFDLAGAVVTFPDLEEGPALVATRGPRPNGGPANPGNPADWEDLKWVPGISPDYPSSSLNPNWRDLVDGRVVLTRGTVTAAHPSDVVAQNAVFEFRRTSDATSFRQAITDTTKYVAQVPSDRIAINLNGAQSGVSRIVITPVNNGQPVRLKLMGRHDPGKGPLTLDGPITHFCAFYQLLQPVPPASEQLIPHFAGNPGLAAANRGGQPSPGPFCPGDWF